MEGNHLRTGGIGQRLANLGIVISGGEHAVDEHYARAGGITRAGLKSRDDTRVGPWRVDLSIAAEEHAVITFFERARFAAPGECYWLVTSRR